MTTLSQVHTADRRSNERLRTIYEDASERLHHLFRDQDDWAGSSIDYVALRLVHERYRELSAAEVRALVSAIGGRVRHCVGGQRLTALYP